MTGELVSAKSGVLTASGGAPGLPSLIVRAGGDAERRYLEFFAAQIRNRNTREAYIRAVVDFFEWAEEMEIGGLLDIEPVEPVHVAAWVGSLRPDPSSRRRSSSSLPRCETCSIGW